MPAENQKAMDYKLVGLPNTNCFLDDLAIVSTGSESDHFNYAIKSLKNLDEDNLRINLEKCHSLLKKLTSLVINLLKHVGRCPLENKTAAILAIPHQPHLNIYDNSLGQ